MPDIDPAKALQRAVEALTRATERQSEYAAARERTTQTGAVYSELGSVQNANVPAWAEARSADISMPPAVTPGGIGAGELGKHGSSAARGQLGPDPTFKRAQEAPVGSEMWEKESEEGEDPTKRKVKGMTERQFETAATQRLGIPEYQWRLDEKLKFARDQAARRVSEPGDGWSKATGVLQKGYTNAATIEMVKNKLGQATNWASSASAEGSQLGFSPQDSSLGSAYVAGFRNPLGLLTSSAGQQTLGMKFNAIAAARFGSGIGTEQALGLRQALAGQGFSNQHTGFMGLEAGGQQENLAQTLEPLVKEGLGEGSAAKYAEATRYGTTSMRSLSESIQDLGQRSRIAKMSIEETAAAQQKYAEEMKEKGGTFGHGLQAAKELQESTGMAPQAVGSILSGTYGQMAAMRRGVMPGMVGSMSGTSMAKMGYSAMDQIKAMIPAQYKTDKYETNSHGEHEKVSTGAEQEAAYAHMIDPSINPDVFKRYAEHGKEMNAVVGGEGIAQSSRERITNQKAGNEKKWAETHPEAAKAETAAQEALREARAQHASPLTIAQAETALNKAQKAHTDLIAKHAQLSGAQADESTKSWGSVAGEMKTAGFSDVEVNKMWKGAHGRQDAFEKAHAALKTKAEAKEKEGQEEGKIEFTQFAKQFLKIKGTPQDKEEKNAGKKGQPAAATHGAAKVVGNALALGAGTVPVVGPAIGAGVSALGGAIEEL